MIKFVVLHCDDVIVALGFMNALTDDSNQDKKWLRVVIKYLMLLQPLVWMTMQESDQPVTVGHMTIHLHREQNTLNLVANVHKMEVLPKVFDHGLDAGAKFIKPGFDISVEDLQSGVPFAAINIKRHQFKVCGKLLRFTWD
ncbi:uncharacterized protein LOC120664251 [Panicum virgatum]|uniref:uncharacterized protein LOC120664251 n=1 Tax=Panicum virgatum TaxID=38727 RepID=UPI0019D699A0|nr:uncharacterized protein LOC120664251 [Panicum virgatum]